LKKTRDEDEKKPPQDEPSPENSRELQKRQERQAARLRRTLAELAREKLTPELRKKALTPPPPPPFVPLPPGERSHEDKLVEIAITLSREEAQDAKSVTYSPRCTILATLPHSDPGDIPVFTRCNGGYSLFLQAGYRRDKAGLPVYLGYPYGVLPRLIIAWITAEAVRTKSREIGLGKNLADFLRELDLGRSGGPRGDITRLKDQMQRLFASRISICYEHKTGHDRENLQLASRAKYFWDPVQPDDESLQKATVVLGEEFYQEILEHPVPLDLRVIKGLRQSSMALDIYSWLTYRMSFLKKETLIPWASLELQFGADYARPRAFKEKFLEHLADVKVLYSHARFSTENDKGLLLYPSRPQVLPKKKEPPTNEPPQTSEGEPPSD
jgi:hypothetical protein